VTGLDLVQLQFEVAAGEPLSLQQDEISISGHAIECRLYAEDPESGFLPSTGTIDGLDLPTTDPPPWDSMDSVRVDTWIDLGTRVTPFYDALLAKIVEHAPSREQALDDMALQLSSLVVSGVKTNRELLIAIVADTEFGAGRMHTGLLESAGLLDGQLRPPAEALFAATAMELLSVPDPIFKPPHNPWYQIGPWRQAWVGAEVRYCYEGTVYRIGVTAPADPRDPWHFQLIDGSSVDMPVVPTTGLGQVLVPGTDSPVRITRERSNGQSTARRLELPRRYLHVRLDSGLAADADHPADSASAQHDVVTAPMPGCVVKVAVAPGDRVKMNQTLVVLEAMKIEHQVAAPREGVVEKVLCAPNDQVDVGAPLVELED
jgi:3-methylcrotonyl-CoA carboxylase alpha subunit